MNNGEKVIKKPEKHKNAETGETSQNTPVSCMRFSCYEPNHKGRTRSDEV